MPLLVEDPRRFARTIREHRETEHLFGDAPTGWKLEAGQAGELIADVGCLTTGYPEVSVRGGAGREIAGVYPLRDPAGFALKRPYEPSGMRGSIDFPTMRATNIPGSILGGYFSLIFWMAGFQLAESGVAAVLNQMSIIFSIILASLLLKEAFTRRKFWALLLAFGGVMIVTFHETIRYWVH